MCYDNCLMKFFTVWIFCSEYALWKRVHGICQYLLLSLLWDTLRALCITVLFCVWTGNEVQCSKMVFRWLYLNIPRYRRSSCQVDFLSRINCFGPQLFAAVLILSARLCRKSATARWRCMALLLAVI